jgi:hypothetical protein
VPRTCTERKRRRRRGLSVSPAPLVTGGGVTPPRSPPSAGRCDSPVEAILAGGVRVGGVPAVEVPTWLMPQSVDRRVIESGCRGEVFEGAAGGESSERGQVGSERVGLCSPNATLRRAITLPPAAIVVVSVRWLDGLPRATGPRPGWRSSKRQAELHAADARTGSG